VLHAGRVRGRTIAVAAAALAAGLATGDAAGAEDGLVSELKLGVQYHDVGLFETPLEQGVDLNFEILFARIKPLAFVWSPRPHLGAHVNTSGDTSQLYFGLTWTFDVTDRFWVAFGGGGAVHNGKLSTRNGEDLQLGSAAQFRWTLEAGVTLTEHHRLSVMLDHVSNAGLARENVGLDTLGVRYGYRF